MDFDVAYQPELDGNYYEGTVQTNQNGDLLIELFGNKFTIKPSQDCYGFSNNNCYSFAAEVYALGQSINVNVVTFQVEGQNGLFWKPDNSSKTDFQVLKAKLIKHKPNGSS